MFICLKSNYVNKLNAVARVGVGAGACICHYQLKRRRIGLIRNMQFGCIYRYEESKIIEPPISFSQIYADHVFLRHLGTLPSAVYLRRWNINPEEKKYELQ